MIDYKNKYLKYIKKTFRNQKTYKKIRFTI